MSKAFLCIFAGLVLSLGPASSLPAQSTKIQDVPVPVPSEVFATLDKFTHSNWRDVQRQQLSRWKPHGDQAEIALRLGVLIAEGFVAVKAEDTDEVREIGHAVLGMARALGVERAALRRSRSIVEHAEKGDWKAVRKEWDQVQPDVEEGMKELKSERLAQLVSLGGWLRGAQVLCALVLQDYSPEKAALLRQPALLGHFEKQLAMEDNLKNEPLLVRIRDGIRKVRPLLDSSEAIPKQTVAEIARTADDLLQDLAAKSKG